MQYCICSAGSLKSELVANFTNFLQVVYITLNVAGSTSNIYGTDWDRRFASQGNAVQRFAVLPNIYEVRIWDSDAALTAVYIDTSIDCTVTSTTCTLPDQIKAALNVDLKGLPASMNIELMSGSNTFRHLYHIGGVQHRLHLLALSSISVRVTEWSVGTIDYVVNNIDCSTGICSTGSLTREIVANLTNFPHHVGITLTVAGSLTYGTRWIREIASQGAMVRRYTVLPNVYDFKIWNPNDSEAIAAASIDCTGPSTICKVTFSDPMSATLNVDLTGLPQSTVDIQLISDTSSIRYFQKVGGIQNQLKVLPLSNITIRVMETYSGTSEYVVNNIDCSTGICSAGSLTTDIVAKLNQFAKEYLYYYTCCRIHRRSSWIPSAS